MSQISGPFGGPSYQIHQPFSGTPLGIYMEVPVTEDEASILAYQATMIAREHAPKMNGHLARQIGPVWGEGWFGLEWDDAYVWFQEIGISPFTMRNLAGKLIPMWIKDPTGTERQKNPRAKVKVGEDGVPRVLIFRRAAKPGQRKTVIRNGVPVSVPRSWPGAPGRIAVREAAAPNTRAGKRGGQIAGGLGIRSNVGVRWRHPGLLARSFLHRGLIEAAIEAGFPGDLPVIATNERGA